MCKRWGKTVKTVDSSLQDTTAISANSLMMIISRRRSFTVISAESVGKQCMADNDDDDDVESEGERTPFIAMDVGAAWAQPWLGIMNASLTD